MADQPKRLHAIVSGMVQGVYFRAETETYAQPLGLTGWVKNLPDGSVETVAEGPPAALEKLLQFLHHGPPAASVAAVQAEWREATGEFSFFQVRW